MKQKILNGYRITHNDAMELLNTVPQEQIYQLANELREHFHKRHLSTCMIMNAKSGACTEDCKWCSQSCRHHTGVPVYKLVGIKEALTDARVAQEAGVEMFSLVTSGRRASASEVDQLAEIYWQLREQTPKVRLCASLGLVSKADLQKLYQAGVRRYHCNIETAPSFFPLLCSTHTMEEKIATIKAAQEVGMSVCSGGIIGMGESMVQRIEMAVLLQQLNIDSIPVNLLQAIEGTPMEGTPPLTDDEVLTTFALFRIVNPAADIRFAAGRLLIKHLQNKALQCGVSASLVGDMLTTVGSSMSEDFFNFKQLGYEC